MAYKGRADGHRKKENMLEGGKKEKKRERKEKVSKKKRKEKKERNTFCVYVGLQHKRRKKIEKLIVVPFVFNVSQNIEK